MSTNAKQGQITGEENLIKEYIIYGEEKEDSSNNSNEFNDKKEVVEEESNSIKQSEEQIISANIIEERNSNLSVVLNSIKKQQFDIVQYMKEINIYPDLDENEKSTYDIGDFLRCFNNQDLSDVTLKVDNKTIYCSSVCTNYNKLRLFC